MSDAERLAGLVATWKDSIDDFVALLRSLPQDAADLPTDLPGWSVRDVASHTAHLEAVLAGGPEETIEVLPAEHLTSPMAYYTEQGVLARKGRTLVELADEIEQAAVIRYRDLTTNPPTDAEASTRKTPGDIGWTDGRLLSNRPLDVWMHEQDIRRAVDRPGGFDRPGAKHVIGVFAQSLRMVLGKHVAPPAGTTVAIELEGRGQIASATMRADGRAYASYGETPTVTITMSPEDYICAAGGRRAPAAVSYDGDADLGQHVVANLAVTP